MEQPQACPKCRKVFSNNSNLARHMKMHDETCKESLPACSVCQKTFAHTQSLERHMRQHLYPKIPLYKTGQARLKCFSEAAEFDKKQKMNVDKIWWDPKTAEKAAKVTGEDLWRSNIVLTFGKYTGCTFKWVMENDIGWAVWLLGAYMQHGETSPRLKWQKECLLEYANDFVPVKFHLDQRQKVRPYPVEMK